MRRSVIIAGALLLGFVALGLGAFRAGGRLGAATLYRPTDDLDWLRLEFQLDAPTLAAVRRLHEGYLPQCEHYCAQIAAAKRELAAQLAATNAVTAEAEATVARIAALRATCQTEMLRHFAAVSRAMPEAQGRRYLAEMQRITLGAHEQIERTMAGEETCPHGCR